MPLVATRGAASAQGFGEFGAVTAVNYIEDVFSTYLYTGNGSTQTITNGIDLAGEGGLVWIKARSQAGTQYTHGLWDTLRGPGFGMSQTQNKALDSSSTAQEGAGGLVAGETDYLSQFASNGFVLTPANNNRGRTSNLGITYASWTFRKQAKFFDVVTYTGNGVAGRTVPHNLGSVPGCIIVKRTDAASNWRVYHRSLGANSVLVLNEAGPAGSPADQWNNTTPSATTFTLGTATDVNGNGATYVAYLFAHDAGGFGLTGTDNVISCGSYTGNGGTITVNLGYEPQWVMIKNASAAADWNMIDVMRGWDVASANDQRLQANSSGAESILNAGNPTATGFEITSAGSGVNASGNTYIYIAIRRGPMKTPTSGTSVFSPIASSSSQGIKQTTGFPVDLQIADHRNAAEACRVFDRLRGFSTTPTSGNAQRLITNSTDAESADTSMNQYFDNTGFQTGSNYSGISSIFWNFRRAPGFFDVVAYTGDNQNPTRSIPHNLAAVPELIIHKYRNVNGVNWNVYLQSLGTNAGLILNGNNATITPRNLFDTPSASNFVVKQISGDSSGMNSTGSTYIAYLFASCPGVSKVGSYTGNGSSQTINCGFTGGARFVMVKRTDSTGNWMVVDTARGLVAAGDPTLYLNSTAAEVTGVDWLDPASSGFIVNQEGTMNANVNGGTYIFLAIA